MDVTVLTPGGVRVVHHDGQLETDGPWLALRRRPVEAAERGDLAHLFPGHVVVSVDPCEGKCGNGE